MNKQPTDRRALIVGAAGFVGKYLADELNAAGGWSVCVTKMPQEALSIASVTAYDLNILDRAAVDTLLAELRPEVIFHLAAQSSVAVSWKNPGLTVDVNIKGTLNLLDAVRDCGFSPRVLLIGSSEEYGAVAPEEIPVKETTLPRPGNIYAVTKNTQNQLGRLYAQAYGLDILSTRSFNHIGPNQTPLFVVADFCRQVVEIEKGRHEPVLQVGNLSAKRDFTDVRDVVRAYRLLALTGEKGETYNVGQGKAVEINAILQMILSLSKETIQVEIDPAKLRPVDVPIIEADISKLQKATGWKPEISLGQTLEETLTYWRNQA
ncbi:GDP-mannose 4,6-dehydratase [Pygmaiobacter massiliensis]|uniref:GDP-mannose 4,6-dehydratase n=1 Tax=Pygmaiobacter massiliensis TaxID=1917873 RepID=UPI000C7CD994|nr:GDP-mannose 4,6-dehydratase [Pygmaiobacter massiliensis]